MIRSYNMKERLAQYGYFAKSNRKKNFRVNPLYKYRFWTNFLLKKGALMRTNSSGLVLSIAEFDFFTPLGLLGKDNVEVIN